MTKRLQKTTHFYKEGDFKDWSVLEKNFTYFIDEHDIVDNRINIVGRMNEIDRLIKGQDKIVEAISRELPGCNVAFYVFNGVSQKGTKYIVNIISTDSFSDGELIINYSSNENY